MIDVPEDWELQEIVDYANGTFLHEGMLTIETIYGARKKKRLLKLSKRLC